jgi:hypothetical protein
MAQTGRPIERVARPADRRGPAVEVYRLPNGQTLRLRTNNKPALMAKTDSGAVEARLPFETEDYVGIAFPAERPNFVVGYLVPAEVVVRAMRDNHREWLASDDEHSDDNQTRVLRFDGDARSLGHGYASRWSEFHLGEIELNVPLALVHRGPGREKIWTKEARELLFSQLVDRFGPHASWEKHHSPGHGREGEFDTFCSAMAELVGAKSADAVKHQIAWGSPVTGRSRWNQSHACNAILNLAAALQFGFIKYSDLPTLEATSKQAQAA